MENKRPEDLFPNRAKPVSQIASYRTGGNDATGPSRTDHGVMQSISGQFFDKAQSLKRNEAFLPIRQGTHPSQRFSDMHNSENRTVIGANHYKIAGRFWQVAAGVQRGVRA